MVHLRGERLALKPKLRLHVGGERRPQLRVLLDEPERAVVHRAAGEQAVVGVHVPLDVPDPHPRRHRLRLPPREGAEHLDRLRRERRRAINLRELAADRVAHKLGELLGGALLLPHRASRVELDVADAQERGRRAACDRAALLDERVRRVRAPRVVVGVPAAAAGGASERKLRRSAGAPKNLRGAAHHARRVKRVAEATSESARVVGTPMWCIASDTRYSRTDERSTARPSPPRENGVVPEPFSCSSQRSPLASENSPSVAERPSP